MRNILRYVKKKNPTYCANTRFPPHHKGGEKNSGHLKKRSVDF